MTEDTPITLLSALESAQSGSPALDERFRSLLQNYPCVRATNSPTQSLDQAIAAIPDYYWWEVARRKNMPDYHMPNPANGHQPFLAYVGLHSRNTGKGNKKGAPGRGHSAAIALCAALVNATQLEMKAI